MSIRALYGIYGGYRVLLLQGSTRPNSLVLGFSIVGFIGYYVGGYGGVLGR